MGCAAHTQPLSPHRPHPLPEQQRWGERSSEAEKQNKEGAASPHLSKATHRDVGQTLREALQSRTPSEKLQLSSISVKRVEC